MMKKFWTFLITMGSLFLVPYLMYSIDGQSWELYGGPAGLALMYVMIGGPIILLFGIPVSLLSDYVTRGKPLRWLWAMLIHTFGGVLFSLVLFHSLYFVIIGGIVAFVFWLTDEGFKWYERSK